MAEREAAQVAKRRALDEAAAEMERQKAKEALEKQQKAAYVPKPTVSKPELDKPAPPVKDIFASIFDGLSDKPAVTQAAPTKPSEEIKGKIEFLFVQCLTLLCFIR